MSTIATPDPDHALTPSGNLGRRLAVSGLAARSATAAAWLAVAVLVILIFYVAEKGISAISWSFLTGNLPVVIGSSGGIGPAIAGTLELVAIATLIALPTGVLMGVYLCEFAGPRIGNVVGLLIDLMAGVPTIIVGVVVYELVVNNSGQSGLAGGLALSVVMLPLIARASLESLSRVPPAWREAADALGVARWRTLVGVVIPGAAPGITTAVILAAARAAGETAPLLLTTTLYGPGLQLNPTHAVPNLPYEIWDLVESGYPAAVRTAWGAAFVLVFGILVANIGARVLLRRSRRRQGL